MFDFIAYGKRDAVIAECSAPADVDIGCPFYVFPVGDTIEDPAGCETLEEAITIARLFAEQAGGCPIQFIS